MKATLHNQRRGSADHNDRNFDISAVKDHHIDPERIHENIYSSYKNIRPFEEAERAFYTDSYSEWIETQNKKYLEHREPKKLKTIDKLVFGKHTKPKEMILQIGKSNIHPDKEIFADCVLEFVKSLAPYAQNFHVIDVAIHNDEETPHAHIRSVWDYIDENGIRKISQEKGLKQLGFELPDPEQAESRYNNRNMIFQDEIRQKWYDICEEHGIEIDRSPIPGNQQHLEKNELTLKMQADQIKAQEEQIRILDAEIAAKQEQLLRLERELREKEEQQKTKQKMLEAILAKEK